MTAAQNPRLIEREFERLLAACFTPGEIAAMPGRKRGERRMMFFAGAKALHKIVIEEMSDDDEITAEEVFLVAAVEAELDDFYNEVVAAAPTEGTA